MRWQNLTAAGDSQHRLPGYRDPAVVRRFDAPEALDMRFYEVQAKSVLNRVPAASRMPFRWTINPFRGCSHACSYCLGGDTQILLANGRTKRLLDVEIGDAIYGTAREGVYRRFAITHVLDKWSSIKPAFAVTLEDGTELVTSSDHRFLTRRGWKHVIGEEHGALRRPHLTLNSKLLGPGGNVAPPEHDDDYKRGYLCGLIRGDGSIGTYEYDRADRGLSEVHRFRLALTDLEALRRAREYLLEVGIATTEFAFHAAVGDHRALTAIRTQAAASVEGIRGLVAWPTRPDPSWMKGFLAGIFDAEGSCSRGILRIGNTEHEIIGWIEECLLRVGFRYTVESTHREGLKPMTVIRLLGGLPEQMRFFQSTDPAITRKRSIEGQALKTAAKLRVTSIRSLGVVERLYDITTGTGDFIANGVVSHNCFARPTHEYLDFNAGRDFEREIVVKVNAPEVARAELSRPSWTREHVAMGTNTDPYQWVEGRYQLMPGIWEALRDTDTPSSILTKSPLLLRDLKVMLEANERGGVSANLSVPTLDEKAWRATEPHTPHPRKRLEAVAELNRAGIPTGILIAPLMPGINDAPEQVEKILELATEAGATGIGGIALHLRGSVKGIFFDWLRENRPDLIPLYEKLYARGAYAPAEERRRLSALVSRHGTTPPSRFRRDPAGDPPADPRRTVEPTDPVDTGARANRTAPHEEAGPVPTEGTPDATTPQPREKRAVLPRQQTLF